MRIVVKNCARVLTLTLALVLCGVFVTKLKLAGPAAPICVQKEVRSLLSNPIERVLLATGGTAWSTQPPSRSATVVVYTLFRIRYATLEVQCDGPSRVVRRGWGIK